MWRRLINFFRGCSLCYCDAIYRGVLVFVWSINPFSTTLISLTEDDDDVRDIGKHDLRSVLIHPILPNANHKTKLKSSRSCLTCSPCEIVPRGLFKTMLDSDWEWNPNQQNNDLHSFCHALEIPPQKWLLLEESVSDFSWRLNCFSGFSFPDNELKKNMKN